MNLGLTPREQELVERTGRLAREKFAARAEAHDRHARFPHEDFQDLFAAGLHAAVVPEQYGGLGIGPLNGTPFGLWMLTKELAKADLSLARCWEGHVNSLVLLGGLGNPEQKRRWFDGVVHQGETWAAWSGEPQAPRPGETRTFGTRIRPVDGGFVVSGSKVFCTSAQGARRAILLVSLDGPGGARYAQAAPDGLLLLACDLADSSISTDDSWWDPIGMRGTVSHLVRFDDTFIPESDQIGIPGQYLKEGWQTLFLPHYAASFLGAAEAAYEYTRDYVRSQAREADPYVQHRVARMQINLDTAHLWLRHVGELWGNGDRREAALAGSRVRYLVERLADDTVREAIHACGARCLIRPSPIERIYRDLSFYLRHDNDDWVLATIGRALLGLPYDHSFHKP